MFRPFQCHFCVCLDGTFMFSAMKQVKQLKISGWPTIFGRDQKNLSFLPFLAFEGRLGGLKDPLEVRVQHETYRSMSGTYVQAILSQKNWTGLAGALRNGRNQSKYDFCSVGWPLLVKNPFFPFLVQIGPNHSEMVPNGPKVVSDSFLPFGTISEWFGPIRIKKRKNVFLPKIANPQSKHSETRYF